MKRRMKILCWLLAASVTVSTYAPGMTVFAESSVTEADPAGAGGDGGETGEDAAALSVDAQNEDPQEAAQAPEKPTLPESFTAALEDNGGLELTEGAAERSVSGCDTVIELTSGWDNQNKNHANINNAAELFQKTSFTVLLDVKAGSMDEDGLKHSALTIGTSENSLRLLTYPAKFGYGGNSGGVSSNMTDLTGIVQDGWNALALTYEEKDGGNGSVIVYVNGEKAAEIADVGFKLSEMSNLQAMLGRSLDTNFIYTGSYDNLVVGNEALDEATAIAETAYRKYAKDNLPANVLALQKAVEEAEALIAAGITTEDLEAALAQANDLLAQELTTDDQAAIDEAASALERAVKNATPTEIVIKGSDVEAAAKNMNGLTYKGFGMLNGNSTSNLLLDYKAENPDEYWAMMNYLFGGEYPLFTHIKMEMGNDGNNSTGAEACTMRYEDEEADASRSPGFVMAADAKAVNPDVKISILRWEMPSWVSAKSGTERYEAIYKWYRETIFDAYEKYGYVVDFVNPDKNETGTPDTAFIKWYEDRVSNETEFPDYMDEAAQEAYRNIRIIASDENKGLKIVPNMRSDADLYDAVDIIGFHYRTDATSDYVTMADVDDKEVWYSEGCATFGYSELQENKTTEYGAGTIGGYQSPLALMDSFITAFDSSRRTHYVFQPAIGSFYEGIQYGHKELLSARDPWSGYIHYDPALYMLEHFSKFAKTGWEDSDPTQNEIWRVVKESTKGSFAGTSNEHATAGIDGNAGYMTLAAPDKSDYSVVFVNNTRNAKTFAISTEEMKATADSLNLWVTETDSYLQNKGTVDIVDGTCYVTIPAYSVATATTLDTTPERAPADDIHNEDRAVLDTDADGRTNGVTDDTVLYADDFDYEEEDENYLAERGNEPRYMLDTHGAWIVEDGKLKHELAGSVSQWNGGDPSTIVGDFRWMDYKTSLDVEIPGADSGKWVRLGVRAQTGMNWNNSGYTLCINGQGNWEFYRLGTKVAGGKVAADAEGKYNLQIAALGDTLTFVIDGEVVGSYQDTTPMLSGRVKISSTWSQVYADNLKVETLAGGIPYALSMIDGQDDSVTYEGSWVINNPGGGSADNWYRTISSTSEAGASFSFPVNGSGFALIGGNGGDAVLDVYVDDVLAAENAATKAAPTRGETYCLTDLAMGEHTVKIVLKSGTLKLDAIHALGERLEASGEAAVGVKTEMPSLAVVTTTGTVKNLPEQVEVEMADGTTKILNVTWNVQEGQFADQAYSRTAVTGTVEGAVSAAGFPVTVSVPVEVIPAGTVYFIDSVDGTPKAEATTESFAAVKAFLGEQLLNQTSDQLKTAENTWGLVDTDAQTKSYTGTDDKMATGIYGKNNATGETLSYALTLPAGTYNLTSAHHEWWSMDRPMTASLQIGDQTTDAGTINLNKNSGDILNTVSFTLDSEQTVIYTVTATGTQAPVISWLAVEDTAIHDEMDGNLKVTNGTIVSGAENVSQDGTIGTAAEKTIVTVKANDPAEGQVFQYWTADGGIVSYDAEYSFYYMEKENLALEAVYGETAPEVTALIRITESDADPDTLKVSFVSERNLPEGSTIKSHGILLSSNEMDEESFVIGGKGVKRTSAATKGLNGTYKVNIKVKKGATLYARGYVIYTDAEGTEHTIYSAAASQVME